MSEYEFHEESEDEYFDKRSRISNVRDEEYIRTKYEEMKEKDDKDEAEEKINHDDEIELEIKETVEQDKEEVLEEDWDTEEELLDEILSGETQEYVGERDEDGLRHGLGKVTYDNKDVYDGQYVKNWKHGYGMYIYNDGSEYTGEWKYGKKNGQGSILYPDGSVYRGQWKDNLRHGYGEYYYTNGDYYLGEWRNDNREGHGSYRYKDTGAHYYGNWVDNVMDGKGELVLGNCVFVGKFENSRPREGKLVFESGVEQFGQFVPKVTNNLWKGQVWKGGKVRSSSVHGGIVDLLKYSTGDILMAAEKEIPQPPTIHIDQEEEAKEHDIEDTTGYEEVIEKDRKISAQEEPENVEE